MSEQKTEFERIVHEKKFRTLISAKEIQERIKVLGRQITEDYRGKAPIMIGVMNGGVVFIVDLMRQVELDLEIDFMRISSYGNATFSSGKVQLVKDINADLKDRHVLLVEDIVDTGLSIQYLAEMIAKHDPASIKFVTLLWKKEKSKIDIPIDYVGFEIADYYVVGYGLDHKQVLRNLPAVYLME